MPNGWTTLFWAVLNGQEVAVAFLLRFGADPNFESRDGERVLMVAAWKGFPTIVVLLLAHGAQHDAANADGLNALAAAAARRHASIAETLAEAAEQAENTRPIH